MDTAINQSAHIEPQGGSQAVPKPVDSTLVDLTEWSDIGALFAADYRGQEHQLTELVDVCTEIDGQVKRLLGLPESSSLSLTDEQRMKTLLQAQGSDLPLTNDILGIAITTFERSLAALGGTNDSDTLEKLGIVVIKLEGVLLKPGTRPAQPRKGNSLRPFNEFKEMPRLEMIVAFLQNQGIYTDDFLVGEGDLLPDQMRRLPYYLVEIPRLNRQLLVCDEVGEQTFVIEGMIHRDQLLALQNKAQLEEKYGTRVRPVGCHNREQYMLDISTALFYELSNMNLKNPIRPKVRIAEQEAIRDETLKQFPTSKEFFDGMAYDVIRNVSILGKKMSAVMGAFGITGISKREVYKLATIIYGEEDDGVKRNAEALEMRTGKDKWRTAIKLKYPTMADFIRLGFHDRENLDINGKGVDALISMFLGIVGSHNTQLNQYKAALAIYEDEQSETRVKVALYVKNKEKVLELGTDKEKWTAEIKIQFPTIESFVLKNHSNGAWLNLDVVGETIHYLGEIFGIDEIMNSKVAVYKLAKVVYGLEGSPELQMMMDTHIHNEKVRKDLGSDKDKWRAAIKEKYPTLQEFINAGIEVDVSGQKIGRIGSPFGIHGNKTYGQLYKIARAVYEPEEGDDDDKLLMVAIANAEKAELLGEDTTKWSQEIQLQYPTYESFVSIKTTRRRGIEVVGKKLSFISGTIYGITRNQYTNENFARLAEMIYFPNGRATEESSEPQM